MNRQIKIIPAGAALSLALLFCVSCRTANPLPPADLSAPGWRVQQGQAIWQPPGHRPELAGDLLFATNMDGNFFMQLAKNPFPLVTAEAFGGQWQIEFGAEEHSWRGRGEPPKRFIWFQLPRALLDGKTAGNWRFENLTTNLWRLENPRSGEKLEGGFFP
ncbi:MAG: hypothetical protein ABUL66_00375 [Verrucomicrobiota bacterium]